MAFVLKVKDQRNINLAVDALNNCLKRKEARGSFYLSSNTVVVGINTESTGPYEMACDVEHALNNQGIGCKIIKVGEYKQLENFKRKYIKQ